LKNALAFYNAGVEVAPGANHTYLGMIHSYNTSAVQIYNTVNSLLCFLRKITLAYYNAIVEVVNVGLAKKESRAF
jgi:hypothetical protein